jgi:hypothetical protein
MRHDNHGGSWDEAFDVRWHGDSGALCDATIVAGRGIACQRGARPGGR